MEEITEVKEALRKALNVEEQGYLFYTQHARQTADENAGSMFRYLAGEEKAHFDRIRELWAENLGDSEKPPEFNPDASSMDHEVFGSVNAGNVTTGRADELDALNAGIKAEKASITLYSYLAKRSDLSKRARTVFDEIMVEEEKHLAILRGELEFVTQTGEYTDFKTITA